MKSLLIEPLEARIAPATLTIATPAAISEGDSGTKTLTFTVTLDEAPAEGNNVSVDFHTVDGTATAGSDYVEQSDTLTFGPGETSKTISVVINGDLEGEDDETFKVQLSNAVNATLGTAAEATGTILNDAKLSISAPEAMLEGNSGTTEMIFTVSLAEGFTKPVSVQYQTVSDTATGGTDFTAQNGTLTFEPGETTKTIAVPILGDTTGESDESFKVQLSQPTNATIQTATATGTILSDDAKLTINSPSVIEGDSGEKLMVFTVTLSESLSRPVSVQYHTVDGTAIAGSDYQAKTGALTFEPGQTTKTILVPILSDLQGEADETFTVELSDAVNASVSGPAGTGTILNDAKISISAPEAIVEGDSGEKMMVFTVSLVEGFDQPVTVQYHTVNGTATAGSDYTAVLGTLTFEPGETTKTIQVPILGDLDPEDDEAFKVQLSQPTHAVIQTASATGTILSDDARLSITNQEVVEGDTGQKMMSFTVTLNGALSRPVSVQYRTADGTATAGSDYVEQIGSLTFAPGETTKTIQVPILGDVVGEADETFTVQLSDAQNASIATPAGTGTILNDAKLAISDQQVVEGDDGEKTMVFTVTLVEGSDRATTVQYHTVNGTATAGTDYTETTGTLTFAPGEISKTISVPILGDTAVEGDETFQIQLSEPEHATLQTGTATGTILEDDAKLSIADQQILEGDSGEKIMTFTVTLNTALSRPVTVKYGTVDGTAVAGSDYLATVGELTFEPGQTSKTIAVPIIGDVIGEANETFTIELSDAENASIARDVATGTILNDAKLSISNQQLVEGNDGAKMMVFAVTLTDGYDHPVTVNYQTANGTATAGTDYIAASGTLTFAAGETSKTIEVPVFGDTTLEGDETFTVQLSQPVHATLDKASGTGTILSDDAALAISNQELLEGDTGEKMMTFTVTLNATLTRQVTVQYRTVDGTAVAGSDYVAKIGTLTFEPGETSKTIQVPILGDLVGEDDETFTIELSDPVNAAIGTGVGTGTILNDAKLSISTPGPLTEGHSGQQPMVFTVTLTEGGNKTVKVNYALDGTAVSTGADADYTVSSPSGTLTFEPGTTSQTIVANVLGDTRKEADETVHVQLSAAENATITQASATGTIVNDDEMITVNDVVITEGDSGFSYANFTLTLATAMPTGQQLVVKYKTVDLTALGFGALADYEGIEETTVTFAPGETTKTISIKIYGDRSYETSTVGTGANAVRAEQFQLKLISGTIQETGSDGEDLRTVNFGNGTGTATIKDNDVVPTVSISDVRVLEGTGAAGTTAKFLVSLSEVTDKDITIRYSTGNGTAIAGEDFTGVVAGEVTIHAGQKTAEIEIPITGDNVSELTETFTVKLLEDVPGDSSQQYTPRLDGQKLTITRAQATGTIVNDDVKVVLEPVTSTTVLEGDSGTTALTFRVKLVGTATQAVTVNFSTQDGTAISSGDFKDFDAVLQTLVFQPGETSKDVTILIHGDQHKEGAETFKVVLTADNVELGGASGRLEQVVTIDEEASDVVPTVSLSYQAPNGGLVEGGKATFTVTLSAPSNVPVEVPYELVDGSAKGGQGSGYDYVKGSNLKVTIPAGQLSATFTVDTIDDALRENAETFTVNLKDPANGAATILANSGSAVVSILDTPDATPTISISDVTVVEGDPEIANGEPVKRYAIFTIKLSAVTGRDVTVKASTLNSLTGVGLATAGVDFLAKEETVTIAAGTQSATFKVEIIGDEVIESDERFFVRLSDANNATLVTEQATGTIQNDDAQFQILFKKADGSFVPTITVDEEGAGNTEQEVSFIIKRLGDLSGTAQANYATVDGVDYMDGTTKVRGAVGSGPRPDFVPVTGSYTFADGQEKSPVMTIKIKPDGTYEGLEEFRVQLEGSLGNYGSVRITDNEEKPTVIITDATVLEGDASSSSRQQSSLVFTVKLSHVDETGVSMTYNTADDTSTGAHKATSAASMSSAVAKTDYISLVNGQLVFAPGETEKTVSVTVLGDNRDEYDESFKLVLSNLQGGASFGNGSDNQPRTTLSATGVIMDNDAEAVVTITDLVTPKSGSSNQYEYTTYSETDTNTASTNKFFLVTLTGETEKVVTVKYITRSSADANPDENVYAIAGEDFVGVTDGTITFDPNATTEADRTVQKVKIAMINDTIVEGDQSFEVFLTEANGATFNDRRGVAVIAEDTNDDPYLLINDITLVEGNDPFTPQNAKFTVTLATKAQRAVTINYATADGTGKATGLFADYVATSGQITFAPGETSQEISVQVLNDIYKEANETFKVQLSGLQTGNTDVKFLSPTGGTGTGVGTATIENGDDTIIGIGIKDLKVVEGAGVKLEVERSIASDTSTSMKVALRNGTAVLNSDYRAVVQSPTGTVTIAANATTGFYEEFGTVNDSTFEFTEHFFADLSGAPAGTEVVKSTARVDVYSDDVRQIDARTVQWIDLDGDLVTLKVSKGSLDGSNISWVMNGDNVLISAVGGRALNTLNLFSKEFQGANVTITSERQPGFTGDANGLLGDGRVNVGFIQAGGFVIPGISFSGIDLGTVKVDGDLGGIYVGDRFLASLSLKKLDVFSLGAHPESTGLYSTDTSGAVTGVNTGSYIQGPVGAINVRTDFAGTMQVTGAEFGDIRSLKIGGALRGFENFNQTGTISFTGTLSKATIGEIVGGIGDLSGRIAGDAQFVGNIGSITVHGDVAGNSGAGSGVIAASSIGKVKVGRLLGGGGDDSGQIRAGVLRNVDVQEDVIGYIGTRSGTILTDKNFGARTGVGVGAVKVGGRLIGGSGELSGIISSLGGITSVTVLGKVPAGDNVLFSDITAAVTGGAGASSGRIEAAGVIRKLQLGYKDSSSDERISLEGGLGASSGTIEAQGGIANTNLFGSIQGGDGADSGSLNSAVLKKVHIFGDLRGGDMSGTGVIAVDGVIGSLILDGSIKGGSSRAATEDSAGSVVNTTGAVVAGQINSMLVKGDVTTGRNLGASLSGSASIAVNGIIGKLTIQGSLLGHDNSLAEDNSVIEEENVYAKILAFGDAKYAAIGKLKIGGDVALAEISAGVSIRSSSLGFPVNADAWINSVEIGGNVRGMNITAGANKGPDGIFGTHDDAVLSANPLIQINDPKRFSGIAKVIIKGSVSAETEIVPVTETNPEPVATLPFGLVAQYIGSVKVGSQTVPLKPGPSNDTASGPDVPPGVAISGVESFRVIELPVT